MFNDLVASLSKRGVKVKLNGNYSTNHMRMMYSALVKIDQFGLEGSWPIFEFTVYGRELDELAEDINRRLPLVEPIIAAVEKHREHREAVRKAAQIGDELGAIVKGERCSRTKAELYAPLMTDASLEPNLDPKTAKEQPIA
ncbi:hypothetical protein BTE77_06880 [Ensifer adhaerens]|nr:hypothetical protein BTE77_06880 [Ensifer adhaerens]